VGSQAPIPAAGVDKPLVKRARTLVLVLIAASALTWAVFMTIHGLSYINTARSDFCGWAEGIPQHQPLPSLEPRSSRPGLFIAPLNVAIANYPGQRFPLRNGALVIRQH